MPGKDTSTGDGRTETETQACPSCGMVGAHQFQCHSYRSDATNPSVSPAANALKKEFFKG